MSITLQRADGTDATLVFFDEPGWAETVMAYSGKQRWQRCTFHGDNMDVANFRQSMNEPK
jgi:hypothetical protein